MRMPARTSSGKAKASMRGDTAFGSFRLVLFPFMIHLCILMESFLLLLN